MTAPDKQPDADITAGPGPASCAPTPHQLGLTANPDLSWEDIGVAEPTPHDLFGEDPDMSWEDFWAALEAGR